MSVTVTTSATMRRSLNVRISSFSSCRPPHHRHHRALRRLVAGGAPDRAGRFAARQHVDQPHRRVGTHRHAGAAQHDRDREVDQRAAFERRHQRRTSGRPCPARRRAPPPRPTPPRSRPPARRASVRSSPRRRPCCTARWRSRPACRRRCRRTAACRRHSRSSACRCPWPCRACRRPHTGAAAPSHSSATISAALSQERPRRWMDWCCIVIPFAIGRCVRRAPRPARRRSAAPGSRRSDSPGPSPACRPSRRPCPMPTARRSSTATPPP